MVCLFFSGLPAQASLMPVCPAISVAAMHCAETQKTPPKNSCCGKNCDCSMESRSQDLLKSEFSIYLRPVLFEESPVELKQDIQHDSFNFSPENDKSPPGQKNHLYDLYSDYRI